MPNIYHFADMVVLVLDFDGTMTDAEVEGRPYRQGCLEDLAVLCGKLWRIKCPSSTSRPSSDESFSRVCTGLPLPEVETLADRFEQELKDNPHVREYSPVEIPALCSLLSAL